MAEILNAKEINRLASLELNLLQATGSLPADALRDARLEASTPIHDTNGQMLFHRIPLSREGTTIGYADVAAHTGAFGSPLLAVAPGASWDEPKMVAEAEEAFRRVVDPHLRGDKYDEIRFVAYSYPKIAVQFLQGDKELAMLECFTWFPVPPARTRDRKRLEPGNFERWSLIDELPPERKEENQRKFEERVKAFQNPALAAAEKGMIVPLNGTLSPIEVTSSWDLHYSVRKTDHHVCCELRPQATRVWCVGASVQMLLDFYRYNYTQTKIAAELGLGTPTKPNGLCWSRIGVVVTGLEALSSNALTVLMTANPTFGTYTSELQQNRPMISFIPGHARLVAGYTESLSAVGDNQVPLRGLLLYDPWPPRVGVIEWENFDTEIHLLAYSARVSKI
ncbi:MAG: C39 family peptidase [Xanthobacteraceae bacterium]